MKRKRFNTQKFKQAILESGVMNQMTTTEKYQLLMTTSLLDECDGLTKKEMENVGFDFAKDNKCVINIIDYFE